MFWFVTRIILAPLVTTSCRLLTVFSIKLLSVIIPTTTIPFSINAIGPCFNSPAGYASECIYDISLSFNDASKVTG